MRRLVMVITAASFLCGPLGERATAAAPLQLLGYAQPAVSSADAAFAADEIAESDVLSYSWYSLVAFILSSGMVAAIVFVFFRRYRKGRSGPAAAKVAVPSAQITQESYDDADFFAPTFFSTDNVPAILVAEDREEIRLFMVNTLRLNYRVIAATTGFSAYDRAVAAVPDLIIVSNTLRDRGAAALVDKLRNTVATSHIPLILVTDLEPEKEISPDEVLLGRFDARELLLRVHALLNKAKLLHHAARRNPLFSSPSPLSAVDSHFISRVEEILRENYSQPGFGIDQLAFVTDMTKLQLHRKVKALTGKAPADLIRHYRVERAKELLMRHTVQLSEVSVRTGFAGVTEFARAFKEVTGSSPVEFAEQARSAIS